MKSIGHLKTYNHVVAVTDNVEKCVGAWADLFGFKAPDVMETKAFFDWVDYDVYKTLYRGEKWRGDMIQTIVFTPKYLLEIKSPGTEDCLREYSEVHGKGIPYFGIVEEENRNAFVERMKKEYGCVLVHDQKYPGRGDWCLLDTENIIGTRLVVKEDGFINDPLPPMMPDFTELSIVVPDIELAVNNWSDIFGIEGLAAETINEKCIYLGETIDMIIKVAKIDGPYPFHLIEAVEGGAYKVFAEKHLEGIHHVSITMTEDEKNAFLTKAKEGYDIGVLTIYDLWDKTYTVLDSMEVLGAYLAIEV